MSRRKNRVILCLLAGIIVFSSSIVAHGSGLDVTYESSAIQVRNVNQGQLEEEALLSIEGISTLNEVWIALRGPGGEVVTYPVAVEGGSFKIDLWLRFGPGTYTIWVGDNRNRFDGRIRFQARSKFGQDLRYQAPSAYVDSNHEQVQQLANAIVTLEMGEQQKIEAIYDWVISHITYDYQGYVERRNQLIPASQVLSAKEGMCREYAFVTAALARAVGLETRVVYGTTNSREGWSSNQHAWLDVKVEGNWLSLDPTWGAGYIHKGSFVSAPSRKYFDITPTELARTYQVNQITLH